MDLSHNMGPRVYVHSIQEGRDDCAYEASPSHRGQQRPQRSQSRSAHCTASGGEWEDVGAGLISLNSPVVMQDRIAVEGTVARSEWCCFWYVLADCVATSVLHACRYWMGCGFAFVVYTLSGSARLETGVVFL